MVVGQDLGVTLDLETWWYRASAKGITQTTDSVVVGLDEGRLVVLHHPTGATTLRSFDWCVLAVPPDPADALYHELKGRVPALHRIGDCLAPRRAHAAVIEGRRVGAAL
jgi:2,4-dienoyl-CoA reductase (NADPH2)